MPSAADNIDIVDTTSTNNNIAKKHDTNDCEINNDNHLGNVLRDLDNILFNFGDAASCTRHSNQSGLLWQQPTEQQRQRQQEQQPGTETEGGDHLFEEKPPSSSPLQEACAKYAPVNLRGQFEQVYRMLRPGLVTREHKQNVSVFLEGPRGSGKSLVLEQCIQAFQDELRQRQQEQQQYEHSKRRSFRIVRLNGILIPGGNVNLVIHEILRQLSTCALQEDEAAAAAAVGQDNETHSTTTIQQIEDQRNEKTDHGIFERSEKPTTDNDEKDHTDSEPQRKRTKTTAEAAETTNHVLSKTTQELFRLKQTTFTNHLQLLNEILQFAAVDDIPILFVLDELDSFVVGGSTSSSGGSGSTSLGWKSMDTASSNNNKDRQLLLYHLLDRVATGNSFLSLVGITCNYGTMNLLEKRIKSRAEGTKFVHFGPCQTMSDLMAILLDKTTVTTSNFHQKAASRATVTPTSTIKDIHSQITKLLTPPSGQEQQLANDKDSVDAALQKRVYESLYRSLRLGYDIRWFCRVFYMAFSAYRHDCICRYQQQQQKQSANECKDDRSPITFSAWYVWDAIIAMGGATPSSSSMFDKDISVAGDDDQTIILPDRRIQALRDLNGPQTTILVAAWRILRRETKNEQSNAVILNLEKIFHEYSKFYSSRRGSISGSSSSSSNNYNVSILWKAFHSLVETGLLRPAMDHSGRVPLQYEHEDSSYREALPPAVLLRLPLHLNLDIHRELAVALQKNIFSCSTTLTEWAKKST